MRRVGFPSGHRKRASTQRTRTSTTHSERAGSQEPARQRPRSLGRGEGRSGSRQNPDARATESDRVERRARSMEHRSSPSRAAFPSGPVQCSPREPPRGNRSTAAERPSLMVYLQTVARVRSAVSCFMAVLLRRVVLRRVTICVPCLATGWRNTERQAAWRARRRGTATTNTP